MAKYEQHRPIRPALNVKRLEHSVDSTKQCAFLSLPASLSVNFILVKAVGAAVAEQRRKERTSERDDAVGSLTMAHTASGPHPVLECLPNTVSEGLVAELFAQRHASERTSFRMWVTVLRQLHTMQSAHFHMGQNCSRCGAAERADEPI